MIHVITETEAEYRLDAVSPKETPYGVSFVNIYEKIDRVITAPHCNWLFLVIIQPSNLQF